MVASICSVISPPRLRGSMISRRVAAPLRFLCVAARRFGWQAGRSRIHRTGSCDRRARHAQAAPKSCPVRAAGCATARPGPEPELIPQSRLLAVPRLPRAATPPRRQVSRRPMVTVIRPSRARCVKGTIPRHERAVFTFKGGRMLVASTSPADSGQTLEGTVQRSIVHLLGSAHI